MKGLGLTLAEVARALKVRLGPGLAEVRLTGVSTDTRSLKPGELFVALQGERFDGHDFVREAFARGAAAAVVGPGFGRLPGRVCLRVADTLRALGDLAAYLRRRRPLKVLAVTGSNGKTTTREMLARVLARKYKVLVSAGNFNNLVGLPLTLFRLRPGHQVAVLEMGTNRPGEIARLTEIAGPDVGLVTNISRAHLEGLGSLEGVARAKGELYAGLSPKALAVVNLDDPLAVRAAAAFAGPRLTFGFDRQARVRARGLRPRGLKGTSFNLVTPEGQTLVRLALLGRHNAANALAAAAGALALNIPPAEVGAALADFRPFPGRLEVKRLRGPVYVLDDTYNANPASARAALGVLAAVRGRGRAVAVLGDMLELGRVSRKGHAEVGRAAALSGVNLLVGVGPAARELARAARGNGLSAGQVAWFPDPDRAAEWLKDRLRPYDRVLVKGSRGMHMEKVVGHLCGEEGE